ncbi:energy-coupling factor ABC transporter ATP-binding protein [Sporanaerobium hydrogeniformans]|uniref:Energy-coupling factor ABC transporter ATP-binding protein n=1 Tax=Sporanaerobium hydrogeniformans TaxID=3072179 RepID=A0AC61DBI9_9FIRM|nr:ATP-binding cassette domain-containing protein [Sporanaerobium hydrogeniformans]PHV70398.1 energy-coupling factor ABC transporter ATP-binding protein [Sporanaerobium hydrogeniformans]
MEEMLIEVKNVSFDYPDGTPALQNIELHIPKGKVIALLGGNGAGKSTLFLHLNGILKPKEGEVCYKGEAYSYKNKDLHKLRQKVGIVFQDPDSQLFSASVYEDVSFGVVNLGIEEKIARERIERALERTGISAISQRPTHSLSYGQKKRVALAGVIAMEPEVLILDEPTAGLDPEGISEIMGLIEELQKELNISVIIATHDIDLVPLYCQYVYVLEKGTIQLEGSPEEVFSKPQELRKVHLRLPRIAHLLEILRNKDKLSIKEGATTISQARRAICEMINHIK